MSELPKIILCDVNPAVCQAWRKVFVDDYSVDVVDGSILELQADAVVSPANSFGFMDGGIDKAYVEFFGPHVQEELQATIRAHFDGELLVGQAIMLDTGKSKIPHIIAAPTMRVPAQIVDIADVYLATRAALRSAIENGFRRVAFPGMGTGTGMIHPIPAAWCMRAAIADTADPREFPGSVHEARHRHFKLPLPNIGNQ